MSHKMQQQDTSADNSIQKNVSVNLENNINYITNLFPNDITIKHRRFFSKACPGTEFCLFFVDGLVNDMLINQNILAPIMMAPFPSDITIKDDLIFRNNLQPFSFLQDYILFTNDISESEDLDSLLISLLSGDALLFASQQTKALTLSTKSWETRGVQEPDAERVMQGPREGFTESLMVNLSLIRRKIKSPRLKYDFMMAGKRSRTNLCVCYMDDIVDKKMLASLKEKINQIDIDCILDTNYIEELIKRDLFSPFKTSGSTERPDIVAAKLMEGHAAIVVDGTPVALTAPFVFLEYFHSNDDYYTSFYFGSFGRILRILGFFLTISTPAIYLSLVTFHQELIPTKFLVNIIESRNGLPFSSLFEMIILILAFELLREGGTKVPSSVGSTLSIVGGLVLGQASVEAKFVSIPIVIIVAFTGITGLMIPQLKGPGVLMRLALLIMASVLGFYGYMLGMLIFLLHLASLDSYGIPYTSLLSYRKTQIITDTFVRGPWPFMRLRPDHIADENRVRQVYKH